MSDILYSLKELKSFTSNGVYKMAIIEWWLLKHEKLYVKTKQLNQSEHLYNIDGKEVRLPDNIGNPTDEEKFIDVYESLDDLSKLHRNETYFKQEMAIYKEIINQPQKVEQWLNKNEKLGSDDYVCFLTDYLDYDKDDKVNHLSIFFLNSDELEVYVDRKDFNFTIKFLTIFSELYC